MSNPSVSAVCLMNGRHEMVERAIICFRKQTYQNKRLVILDTGSPWKMETTADFPKDPDIDYYPWTNKGSVGALRNLANRLVESEIIIHWDSDDWSHPQRIEEQVELLQSSGKQCVGYREMLFWNTSPGQFCGTWLYKNTSHKYCLGTSLCYWRKVWEERPFPNAPKVAGESGEDTLWLREINSKGVSSIPWDTYHDSMEGTDIELWEPRMVASIHGGNTSTQYQDIVGMQSSPSWKRAPEWDKYCAGVMHL